ncbi:glycosyltransferase [Tsuneonella sp. CC-YZS046]|nr:glycosyltransferase [Tsuneonella sp. CC-YZS046]WRO68144.1 glycosyltransferase [Tsuneonella sp. CC-YZS046]
MISIPLLLCAADAMVLPSESEGLANAWVEALACGCPLVISDAGGAREILRDASAGLIAERDPRAIAAAVRAVLAAPSSPEMVAQNAAQFSWRAHAERLAEYYEGLLKA